MPVRKRVADVLTASRILNTAGLLVVGFLWRESGLSWAAVLVMIAWTTDSLDGPLARNSRPTVHTWIGDHDLEIDMSVAAGLLGYLSLSGLVDYRLALAYTLIWTMVFWRLGESFVSTRLSQAPVYIWFLVVTFRRRPNVGWWMVIWMVLAMIAAWPRFSRVTVPTYLAALRSLIRSGEDTRP